MVIRFWTAKTLTVRFCMKINQIQNLAQLKPNSALRKYQNSQRVVKVFCCTWNRNLKIYVKTCWRVLKSRRSKEIKAETSLIYYFKDCVNICWTPHKKVKPVLTAKQEKFRIRSELLVDCCPKIIKPKKNSKKTLKIFFYDNFKKSSEPPKISPKNIPKRNFNWISSYGSDKIDI